MVMSAAQVTAELQRKRNLGIAPTNKANMGQYNALKPMTPATPTAPASTVKPVVPGAPVTGMPASGAKPPGAAPVTGVPGPVMAGAGAVTPAQTALATPPPAPAAAPPAPTGFTYNPETDPAYQARKAQIEASVKTGTNNAMVSLGARGIGNSSSAITAAMQQQQQGINQLQNSVIPELEQQAYQRYSDEQNRKYQDEQLAIQQGQLTGVYESPEMKALYNEVLQAKQDYANAKTPEERATAHQRAETARGKLEGMNANAGLAGSDVTLEAARGNSNKFGVQTQEAIQNEWNRKHTEDQDKIAQEQWNKTFNLNSTQVMASLTGYMPDGKPTSAQQQQGLQNLWTLAEQTGTIPDKLADMYGLKHGTKTQEAQQQMVENLWTVAEQTGTIPDALADMYSIPHGTKTEAAKEFGLNYALAKDDNAQRWASFNLSKSNSATDNARQSSNAARAASDADYDKKMDIWKATGKAPKGLEQYGVQPGTPYGSQDPASTKEPTTNEYYSDVYSNLDQMTPTEQASFLKGEKASLIAKLGPEGYKRLLADYKIQ